MPIYSYKGYDAASGANRKGKIEAESERSARTRLKSKMKIIVAEIKEEATTKSSKSNNAVFSNIFGPKVSVKELAVMVRQFAVLQRAHVPLDESLKALVSQVENPELSKVLAQVKDSVSEGKSLADSSAKFPGVFNRLYVNMVRAGESSGNLGTVLTRLSEFLEYQVKVGQEIVAALTYPIIMITGAIGVVAYLFISVVPKLAKVFDSLRVPMPWYSKLMIDISDALGNYWYVVLTIVVLGYVIFKKWVGTDKGRRKMDRILLKLPLFGPVLTRISISRFTKTLSTLLSSGVPIVQALDITKNVVTNSVISDVIEQAKIDVQEGKSLASCISGHDSFPGLVTHMIATGEATGELEGMLVHVAEAYEAEVQSKISSMISLIEPLMLMVMFGIVMIVVGAMMIPMLNVMSQIR